MKEQWGAPAGGWPTFCGDCGTGKNVTIAPNPFAEEIRNDSTPMPMCDSCRHEALMDI